MQIAVAAELAKKHTPTTKQQRFVSQNLVHAALKKKHVPITRSPVIPKKNRAVLLAAATRSAL